jgi:PAS domain S-box-containing protein
MLLLALHLCTRLRDTLMMELSKRLRVSAEFVVDALARREGEPLGPDVLARMEEVRRATLVSEIFLYDVDGTLLGGSTSQSAVRGIPRQVRFNPSSNAAPTSRAPEHDGAGGLSLLVPLGADAGAGAILTRIDREGTRGLATVDLLFQIANVLAGVVIAAGLLILMRWVAKGAPPPPSRAAVTDPAASDVDMVLGTMTEIVSTLNVSKNEYRDRMTVAEASAEHYRKTNDLILESITSAIVAFDSRGRITMFNRAAERIFSVSRSVALGQPIVDTFGAESRIVRLARDVVELDRTSSRAEIASTGPDGETIWLGASSSVIRRKDGASVGGILLLTDLTETKRLREQMGLHERLSAVGEMSAGIAHEIKNSLHSLMGFANLLREDFDTEPPLAVKGILSEVLSLESLVKGILEFSKPAALVRAPTSLNELVLATSQAVAEPARVAGAEIVLDLAEDLAPASVDAEAVKRVFLNLALNAVEAMGDGGTLSISTRRGEITSEVEGGAVSRPAIRVGFRDGGPGIDESERSRIFTPFHSTKRDGNGLGLALVHRTVTDHGGRILLHSRVGVGSEFVVLLPEEES